MSGEQAEERTAREGRKFLCWWGWHSWELGDPEAWGYYHFCRYCGTHKGSWT